MRRRAHPRAVGAFVLGAVAILIAAILTLSSGEWFVAKERFVLFFPGSVRGLSSGSAVTFRGIRTGEVKEVRAVLTGRKEMPVLIEVVIELRADVVEVPSGVTAPWQQARGAELARSLAANGVRARLLSQSLLTGQKYIDLDFLPEDAARYSGIPRLYPELPTTPSGLERLSQRSEALFDKIADQPIEAIIDDFRGAARSLRGLLESAELRGAISGTSRTAAAAEPALAELSAALADVRRLSATLDGQASNTGRETTETAQRLRETLDRFDRTLGRVDETASAADETRLRAAETLEQLSRTLAALRSFAEYVQTHPEAMVQGKAQPEEKRK